MRNIFLQHSDLDSVTGESWTETEPGYVLNDHIVLFRGANEIGFHYFDEAIGNDQQTVSTADSKIINLNLSGASVEGIDLAKLATMTVAELAETLVAQIH